MNCYTTSHTAYNINIPVKVNITHTHVKITINLIHINNT